MLSKIYCYASSSNEPMHANNITSNKFDLKIKTAVFEVNKEILLNFV